MRNILCFLIIISLFVNPTSGVSSNITNVEYNPKNIEQGNNVTIIISFENISEIKNVRSFYCRIQPDYLCHFPILQLEPLQNQYITTFQIKENSSQIAGFNFEIMFNNNTSIKYPSEYSDNFGLSIAEPAEGIYYYILTNENISSQNMTSSLYSKSTNTNELSQSELYFISIPLLIIITIKNKEYR